MKPSFFDGVHLKGFNLPVDFESDFGWDVYGKEVDGKELYAKVSAVYRAENLNESAVASMPFVIYDKAGNEWDTSADYQNKLGFLPNPGKLFGLWRKSLSFTNKGFGLFERRNGVTELRYIVPTTIQIDSNERDGVVGYWRQLRNSRTYYPVKKGQMVGLLKTDYDTEILPSDNTEFRALMAAANILYWSDYFVGDFFKRGGIKPHMLFVKGMLTQEERERIESVWDKLMRGLRQFMGKVYQADAVTAQPLGSGVNDFKDNEFYKSACENVAMVSGIPLSVLLSNSANFATARQEYKTWYDTGVVPWCNFIAHEFSFHVLSKFDLTLEFLTEQTDPDMEEEFRRSNAFVNYASAFSGNGNPKALSLAAQIVGVDLPKDVTLEMLDERDESLLQKPAQPGQPGKPGKDQQEDADAVDDEEKSVTIASAVFVPNADQIKELKTWLDIAERKHKKNEGAAEWKNSTLPPTVFAAIDAKLKAAQSLGDISNAFDLSAYNVNVTPNTGYMSEIVTLAEAINRLAESKGVDVP